MTSWKNALREAIRESGPQGRFMQLSTVDESGQPANRTVVFRGFSGDDESISFVTDARSQKISHINSRPRAEICWYFAENRIQFRIRGTVKVIHDSEPNGRLAGRRHRCWKELSESTQRQFFWPPPMRPRSPDDDFVRSDALPDSPPPTFCLCFVTPDRVDQLDLNKRPHSRIIYSRDESGSWSYQTVNP